MKIKEAMLVGTIPNENRTPIRRLSASDGYEMELQGDFLMAKHANMADYMVHVTQTHYLVRDDKTVDAFVEDAVASFTTEPVVERFAVPVLDFNHEPFHDAPQPAAKKRTKKP